MLYPFNFDLGDTPNKISVFIYCLLWAQTSVLRRDTAIFSSTGRSAIEGRVLSVRKRLISQYLLDNERRLSPTKRTEKTGLEPVDLTAPCPSVTGQERSFR
jgi:hypothetical protein